MTETLVEETTQQPSTEDISELTEAERLARRREKFGIFSTEDEKAKKVLRAQRFSIVMPEIEEVKMQQRAERFRDSSFNIIELGGNVGVIADSDEIMKRKRRAERFGIETTDEKEKRKKSRAERFNISAPPTLSAPAVNPVGAESVEAKLAARQLRFGVIRSTKKR